MGELTDQLVAMKSSLGEMLNRFVAYLPSLLAALLTLLAGFLVARFVRGLLRRTLHGANRILDRWLPSGALSKARISPRSAAIIGEMAFWLLLFLAIAMAARVAGLTAVSLWLDAVVAWLPNFIIGAAIIAIGFGVGALVGEQVTSTGRAASIGQSAVIGRLVQAGVFVTSLIIGLGQIGIDVSFLIILFAVGAGAIGIGFSIAFGIGAGDFVRDLVSARDLRRELHPGLVVKLGKIEGEILEVSATRVVVETADGRVLFPARKVADSNVLVRSEIVEDAKDE